MLKITLSFCFCFFFYFFLFSFFLRDSINQCLLALNVDRKSHTEIGEKDYIPVFQLKRVKYRSEPEAGAYILKSSSLNWIS